MTSCRRISTVVLLGATILGGCGGASTKKHAVRHPVTHVVAARPFASDQPADLGSVSSAPTARAVLASTGFAPGVDGFSFENYGFIAGTEIDQHDMRELFGDQVCAGAPSDSCTFTPAAQQWAQQVDAGMLGGHCFGFSVTALRFFKHDLSPSAFGAAKTFSLSLSPALQSELAYGWAMQVLPSVQKATVSETPTQEIAFLKNALAEASGEAYTIGIFRGHEGHAVTPIAVEDLGGGRFAIDIYDNNFPGTRRAILVDTNTDSWSYEAAANPSDPSYLYGGRGLENPMQLIPLSPGLGRQPCPFCGAPSLGSKPAAALQISLAGNPVDHGHLLITGPGGRRLGYVHGHFVDEIKGARVLEPLLSQDFRAHPEPIYQLPAAGPVRVTLDGSGATGHDRAAVYVTGPGFGATVSNLTPNAGSLDRIAIAPGGDGLSLRSVGPSSVTPPILRLGLNHGRGGSVLTVRPRALVSGTTLKLALHPGANRVALSSSGASLPGPVALTLSQVGPNGTHTAQSGGLPVRPGHPATFSLGLLRIG
jgi:hypothetical protein